MFERGREKLIERVYKMIEEGTGLTREFIDTHSFYELEEILGIPHYSIEPAYEWIRLKCGCTVKVVVSSRPGDW